jgi:two-component sensor histidine kinase
MSLFHCFAPTALCGEVSMVDVNPPPTAIIVAPDPRERSGDWELLVSEAYHRMKNTLTLLGAWLRLDLASAGSADFPEAVARFERRILGFAKLYEVLSDKPEDGITSIGEYIERLCGALTAAILEPTGVRCELAIQDGVLASNQCQRLGLIIAELVTNAAKHAFPDHSAGLIRVEARYRDGFWHCTVADNGIGATNSLQGSGVRIIEDLARSIRAHTHIESGRDGTIVTVVVPAS